MPTPGHGPQQPLGSIRPTSSSAKRPRSGLLLAVAVLALLGACAPAAGSDERVEVAQLTEAITYYPYQTGASWQYLREGDRLNDPRASTVVDGPTIVDGEVWVSFTKTRPGYQERGFRRVTEAGVFLHSKVVLGLTTITYDPPLQEFPAEGTLRVGAQWTGETTATMVNHGRPERESLSVQYVYTVVDRRNVNTPAGPLEVFVIDLTLRSLGPDAEILDEETTQAWFTPFVGEVRTNQGWVLIASNVLTTAAEGGG